MVSLVSLTVVFSFFLDVYYGLLAWPPIRSRDSKGNDRRVPEQAGNGEISGTAWFTARVIPISH